MKNLSGIQWSNLSVEEQNELLLNAEAIDGRTGNKPSKTMDCIIDLGNEYSINGKFIKENGEEVIEVADDEIMYTVAI